MIQGSKLKKLVECIVKQTLDEIELSLTGDSSVLPAASDAGNEDQPSTADQQKLDREKKRQAQEKLKQQKREYEQAKRKEKSLESDYKVTRRYTVPNMKKALDAQKLAITKM